jgi:hypothetical protein
MKKWTWSLLLLFAVPMTVSADTTREEIVKLAKAGIGDEVIMAFLRQNPLPDKLTSDDIIELKKAGVSDRVLNAMLATPAVEKRPAPVKVAPQPRTVEKVYVTAPRTVYYTSPAPVTYSYSRPTYPSYTYRSYSYRNNGCGPVRYSNYYTPRYSRSGRYSFGVNWCW